MQSSSGRRCGRNGLSQVRPFILMRWNPLPLWPCWQIQEVFACQLCRVLPSKRQRDNSLQCAELGAQEAVQLDKQLLKAEVRPGVFEDIRMQADEETRLLLANLKVHQLSIHMRTPCIGNLLQQPPCSFPISEVA